MRRTTCVASLVFASCLLTATVKADPPTTDQQGVFFGKGSMTYYWLDGSKSVKVKGEFILQVNADGSGILTTPDYEYGTITTNTNGTYGVYRGTFDAVTDRGRLEIKSNGPKSSMKMYGRYASTGSEFIIEYTASLKKLPSI